MEGDEGLWSNVWEIEDWEVHDTKNWEVYENVVARLELRKRGNFG